MPWRMRLLCGVGLVVHEEEFEVAGVVDQESLVAGWHHVARLPVVAIADLYCAASSASIHSILTPMRFPMIAKSPMLIPAQVLNPPMPAVFVNAPLA